MGAGAAPTERWRGTTLRKLGDVCERIAKLKAGEQVTLASVQIPGEEEPGETPLERLERFKLLLNETLAALAEGTHGRCEACGEAVPNAELDEMPWATVCGRCAAKGRGR